MKIDSEVIGRIQSKLFEAPDEELVQECFNDCEMCNIGRGACPNNLLTNAEK